MSAPHMPMMNADGLLECPFCGSGSAIKDYSDTRCMHSIICDECGCQTGDWLCIGGAVKVWNTRNGHLYTTEDFKQAGQERDYGL